MWRTISLVCSIVFVSAFAGPIELRAGTDAEAEGEAASETATTTDGDASKSRRAGRLMLDAGPRIPLTLPSVFARVRYQPTRNLAVGVSAEGWPFGLPLDLYFLGGGQLRFPLGPDVSVYVSGAGGVRYDHACSDAPDPCDAEVEPAGELGLGLERIADSGVLYGFEFGVWSPFYHTKNLPLWLRFNLGYAFSLGPTESHR